MELQKALLKYESEAADHTDTEAAGEDDEDEAQSDDVDLDGAARSESELF